MNFTAKSFLLQSTKLATVVKVPFTSIWKPISSKKIAISNSNFNNSDITPTILDCGNEILLANWPNDKHIICNVNNDIPVKIPSHPYF